MSNEWAINRGLSWKWNSCSLQLTIQPTLSINHSCIHMHYYCLTCDLSAIQIFQRRQNISSLEYTLVFFFVWLVFYIKTIIVEQLIKHKTISVGSLIKDFLKTHELVKCHTRVKYVTWGPHLYQSVYWYMPSFILALAFTIFIIIINKKSEECSPNGYCL